MHWCAVGVGGVPDRGARSSWSGSLVAVEREEFARNPSGDAERDHKATRGRSDVDRRWSGSCKLLSALAGGRDVDDNEWKAGKV